MFNNLSERLGRTLKNLSGRGRLTDDNIKEALRDVRIALLEADVHMDVVKSFENQVRERALGQEVMQSLDPGQALVKVVNQELVHILGDEQAELNLKAQPPVVIMMAGLQGSGKTTTAAKLARYLMEEHKKTCTLVSADIYRPAAIDQLESLTKEIGADFFPSSTKDDPVRIAKAALDHAKKQFKDILIIDTAGRLHIDDDMMKEIKALNNAMNPTETLFVVDSMTGQDAAKSAKAFNDTLPLTGIILTKTDGDARGGAALSTRMITGKPIKFMGVGEKTDALEAFHPDRVASRILGMGDILSLVEEAERKLDKKQADKLTKKLKKGRGFDLADFQDQLKQMNKMGGVGKLIEKLPLGMNLPPEAKKQMEQGKSFAKMEAIINSMTTKEKHFPNIINGSRKRRIATGSGNTIQDVNRMLKQFTQMQKMMKKMAKPGKMKNMMKNMQGMLPPDAMG